MAKYLPLPDGTSVTIREGETPQDAWARAQRMYPEAFQSAAPASTAESGFTPALKSGYSELKSGIAALAGRTGIMDQEAAEKYIKEQEAYQQRTFKPTATFGEAPVTKTLELLGGSLPYMAAPVVAGGAVALTPLTGTAATIAGLGAAGAASAGQFTGSNLRRQMEEGKALGETELGAAAAAALPQAALDMVSFRMIPGIRQLFTTAGKEIAPAAAKRIAEQGVKDIAKDYTLATGKAMTAEGLTEAGQQVLERMQAGLSLTDEKARSEYIDSLIGGAVLGGVLSPAGRYVERRGEAAKQEAERLQKAQEVRAQEEAVKEAARAQRATPEGQLAFAQDYEARLAEYNQLKALKKPSKDADPLAQVEFKETRKRMGELREGLTRDSVEYRKARETVRTLAEQQRLQGLSPEAFMLEQMGLETPAAAGAAPKTRTVINEFGQIVEEPIEAPKAEGEAPSAGEQYLNQQVDAARQMGILDVADMADFAMQDPALAAQAVKEGAGVQGLSPQENGALLGGIRLRLKALEKQAANQAKAEMAQRTEDMRAQKPGAEADAQQQAAAEMYEAQTTTLREGEPNFDYLDPIFEKALSGPEEVVKVDESVMPVRNAAALRARIDALEKEIADAREKEAAAKSTRNPSDVVAARQTIAKLNDQLGAMAGESGGYVTQLVEARRQQQEALTAINDAVDQLRSGQTLSGPNKVMASSTEQSLRNKAETARAQLVTAALQEAAIQRRAEGAPAMTRDEALKAAIKLSDTVNEMVERGATQAAPAEFEEVIVEPAQMRGDKIVRAARTERRMVKPAQQRISDAELKHFQERIKTVTRQLDKVAPKAEKADTGFLKQQFATTEAKKTAEARGETATTLAGELRRRTEFVRDKMARMKLTPKNVSKEWTSTRPGKDKEGRPIIVRQVVGSPYMAIRNSLNEAADALDSRNVSREFLDAVEPVVDAVLAGRELSPADLRAIDDALAAARPTAVEQKEAGQKALFPETEEDLGYIRATPANFAKSPRIKPVWEALANARVAAAKLAKSTAQRKALTASALDTLEKLQTQIENIESATKYLMGKDAKFSEADIAKAFVEFPEIGQTPEERALVSKYFGRSKLTDAEAAQVERIVREFREKHMAQYAQQIRQAQALLAQGVRLDAMDNSLAEFMQSSNAAAKQAAKALAERIAPMRTAIAQIRSMMRKTPVLTESQKILARADEAVKKQRDDFQHAVEQALMKSKAELDSARAALLDPQLAQVQGSLDDAKKRLEKEQAELDRVQKRYNEILTQESGRDRTQLATYQLFRYEEKKAIIDDLKAQIAKQETALAKLVEDRFGELDGAAVTAQAMLDKNVRMERDYLEMLEAQLAGLRGENVLDKPNAYPFASRRAQLNVEAQKKLVQAAEKRADDFKKETAKAKEEVKQQWSGLRRVSGVVQSLDDIRAQERADKLREEAMSELRRADEKAQRDAEKQAVIDDIIEEQNKLALEIAKYPGPISRTGLVELMSSDKPTADEKALYTLKLDLVQRYGILDAQIDAIKEGKPRRAPQPATAPSSALMSAQKPLRSGSDESLAESREANRLAQQIRGTKAAPEPKPSTRVQRKPLDENMGLFDEDTTPDLDGLFRTTNKAGPGMKAATIAKIVNKMSGDWTKMPEVEILADETGLPDRIYQQAVAQNKLGKIPGLYDPVTKKVYLIAANLKDDADVVLTVTHEVAGHFGLREMLGNQYATTMNDIYNGNDAVRSQADAKMSDDPALSREVAVEEVLADMAETGPNANQKAMNALRRVYYAIKRWLRDTFGLTNVSDAEVRQLVADARRFVKKGVGARGGTADSSGVVYSDSRGGATVEFENNRGIVSNESVLGGLRRITSSDDIAADAPERVGAVLLTGLDIQAGGKRGRASDVLRALTNWADANNERLVLVPSASGELRQADLVQWYERNGFKTLPDGAMERSPGVNTVLYRTRATYASPEMERLGEDTDKFVAKQRGTWEKVKANTTGLAFATQLVDRFAGFERLAKYMDSLKGSQMLYYLRMYDQRMNFVSQAVGNGAPQIVEKTRADGRKEYVIEAKDGANIKNVVQILSKAQPMVGNAEAVNRTFTLYLAALRAQRVGLAALNFGKDVTQDMLDNAINVVERTPGLKRVFDDARNEYNSYNRDLMKFLASTGAISEKLAERLSSTNDYIPFYREQDGNAMLIIGGENPIRIGNIAEQPYLQELVGGDTAILDFMTSSVQNTNMLMDMGLRNLSTKNAVFELVNLNAAKIVKKADGPDVVRFKVDGEDRYAVLDTETVTIGGERFSTGVPAELLVKGMEGIPTQMPALMRLMAVPAQLLRKAVTLSPMYMAKQLFRDSLAAPIVSGANFTPVFGAIRQINGAAGKTLEERGITGGQYMSGTNEDITKILRDIATGKPGFMTAIGKLEALGMKADSLTRRAQYNSYIAQGMSEMEATLMALESMNFNKRGASPSVHMANSLIPFFNAQIQGLNVLYKAFTGQMPFNDKLKVQQKLLMRGAMIAAVSLIYAAMMEDDEAYKNATPDQKYGNWFVRIPGLDEPVRLPVPFEIGYIFKGIPEALYNTMTTENGGEEAVKAFRQILLQTIPGGSSMPTIGGVPIPIPMPQALKPAIEAGLGKSFYTGRDILSAREKELLPEQQFRANTAEVSKALGQNLGISPVIFESLVRGYTGTLGLAFLHTLSLGAPKSESPEAAVKRLSDYPLVGGAFQPNDAGGISNAVYERFNEDIKVRNTYKDMLSKGQLSEANELLQRRGNEIMEAEIGDVFKTNMTKLTQAERAIAASNLSPEEKRAKLDEIRRIKTGLAQTLREAADRTRPQ